MCGPPGSTDPVTNADHVQVRAGQSVTVAPLTNDTSGGSEPLRLARVDEVHGATVRADFAANTFAFTSSTVGVYYVQYLAAVGSRMAPGVVRVDVLEATDSDLPPVAVRDVALLPSGGEVLVNALVNDSDPGGGILVIQSVSVDPDSGISVSVLGHETLRISDQGSLAEQITIGYTISNGTRSADGEVVVIPVPSPAKLRPPVANDDQVVVRAGDVVTIPVLDNDYHPNGDTMHVAPDLVDAAPRPRGRRDLRLTGHRAIPRGSRGRHGRTPPTRSSTAPGRRMPATSRSRSSRSTPRPTRRHIRATSSPACSAARGCASPSRSTASTRTATPSSSSASPPRPARAA